MKPFRIESALVGGGQTPFIVAEMSGNHNQSFDRAMSIVEHAARAGAHALKLQTYTADTMTIASAATGFSIEDPKSLWAGRTLHDLYAEAATPWEWHEPIFARCRELGVVPFSSPFDGSAVDFLETFNAPAYKIASFELVDLPLIRKCAATGKPLIISTGMATLAEIHDAVAAARDGGAEEIMLLKCTSSYPAEPTDSNLATLAHLREVFGCHVGLSDHTLGHGVACAAVAMGAVLVEKHFTLCRADGGVDSAFSLEPAELQTLVTETRRAWQAIGTPHFGPTAGDAKSLQFRRSLYAVRDIPRDKAIDSADVRAIRPGLGLAPKHLTAILGMRARTDIAAGTPIQWHLLG